MICVYAICSALSVPILRIYNGFISSAFNFYFISSAFNFYYQHWVITVRRDDDFNYKCVVERPEGLSVSYLFFQEFRIDVTGAVVEGAEVEVS